jgi:hypothetical protein
MIELEYGAAGHMVIMLALRNESGWIIVGG